MSGGGEAAVPGHGRSRARRSAVQAYYQWQMTRQPMEEIIGEFESERRELHKADIEYFRTLLRGMAANAEVMDAELEPLLDRPVRELDPVERAVLHLGAFELLHCTQTPWRVVINEAVELAKMFGAEQSHKYINGVLDKLARRVRATEIAAAP
jgi:N utilization substance protein B